MMRRNKFTVRAAIAQVIRDIRNHAGGFTTNSDVSRVMGALSVGSQLKVVQKVEVDRLRRSAKKHKVRHEDAREMRRYIRKGLVY